MNQSEINSARDALLEVAERLRQQAASNKSENASAAEQSQSSLTGDKGLARIPIPMAGGSSLVNEHRKLFGYTARKKQPKRGVAVSKRKVQTCSLKFVCMAGRTAVKPPTAIKERTMLANAGLGDATIVLDADGDSLHFHEKIIEAYPKVSSAGYELLLYDRCGDNPSFCNLKHPYLPKKLKEVAGQSKIYIQPLQKDLIDLNEDETVEELGGPLIACIVCKAMVPMTAIDKHHISVHGSEPKQKKKRSEPSIVDMFQQQSHSDGGESSRSYVIKNALMDLVPAASSSEIDLALCDAGGNADKAAQQLLSLQDEAAEMEIINTLGLSTESSGGNQETTEISTLEDFRQQTVDESARKQRFTVCREDGLEELKKDILCYYKSPEVRLKSKPRVTFEGEQGVGSGPVREFLLCAVKIIEDGIERGGKPLMFLEGEDDHKVPIHDQALRCTGAFKAIGRIIGHSVLHGGPVIYGLSPAVVEYWRLSAIGNVDDTALESMNLVLQDIPDFELRSLIQELDNLSLYAAVPNDLLEAISPYLFESGLDIDMINSNRKLIVQGLVLYNVIHKRRRELDEIAKGMNETSVHTFLGKCPYETVEWIFPASKKRYITAQEVNDAVVYEDRVGHEDTIMFFNEYLCELEKYEAGKPSITDLCCFWTASNNLPARSSSLMVKFHDSQQVFPFAETCFLSIVLPTVHSTYKDFKNNMDIALKHGSMGIDNS